MPIFLCSSFDRVSYITILQKTKYVFCITYMQVYSRSKLLPRLWYHYIVVMMIVMIMIMISRQHFLSSAHTHNNKTRIVRYFQVS